MASWIISNVRNFIITTVHIYFQFYMYIFKITTGSNMKMKYAIYFIVPWMILAKCGYLIYNIVITHTSSQVLVSFRKCTLKTLSQKLSMRYTVWDVVVYKTIAAITLNDFFNMVILNFFWNTPTWSKFFLCHEAGFTVHVAIIIPLGKGNEWNSLL